MTWGSHRRPTPVQPFPRASVPPVGVCRKHTGRAPRSVPLFLGGGGNPLWGSDPTPTKNVKGLYAIKGPPSSLLCQAARCGPTGRAPGPAPIGAYGTWGTGSLLYQAYAAGGGTKARPPCCSCLLLTLLAYMYIHPGLPRPLSLLHLSQLPP